MEVGVAAVTVRVYVPGELYVFKIAVVDPEPMIVVLSELFPHFTVTDPLIPKYTPVAVGALGMESVRVIGCRVAPETLKLRACNKVTFAL
jgi:hypothetical protein